LSKIGLGEKKWRGSMTVTVGVSMRPLQTNGPASVFFSVVVDEEVLKQTVLTNVAVVENGRIVPHGRHAASR
jgi:hypothetical protein